jgi:hypothetical protein
MWKARTWVDWTVAMTSTRRASNNGWLLKIYAQYVKNQHWAPRKWQRWQTVIGASVSTCHTTLR